MTKLFLNNLLYDEHLTAFGTDKMRYISDREWNVSLRHYVQTSSGAQTASDPKNYGSASPWKHRKENLTLTSHLSLVLRPPAYDYRKCAEYRSQATL